jgi:hypothetical protein
MDEGGGTIAEALGFRKASDGARVMVSYLCLPPHPNLPKSVGLA